VDEALLPPDQFLTLEGATFQYLDWGGTGMPLLLLPGLGCSVHIFCEFAPRFTDHFHVIGFNRRGHGLSDMPVDTPTIASLAEDSRRFLDALALRRTILVGHSLGGREISELASRYPERVERLVYLDGAVDMRDHKVEPTDPFDSIQHETPNAFPSYEAYVEFVLGAYPDFRHLWGRAMDANFRAGLLRRADGSVEERFKEQDAEPFLKAAREYSHPFDQIKSPALAFYALSDAYPGIPDEADAPLREEAERYWTDVIVPWKRAAIDRFLRETTHAQVVELVGASHYLFVDRQEQVVHAMRDFLLRQQ
jgi:pimeloyl-ACP methyl ester carboxylesterase